MVKTTGKNMSKILSGKYSQKILIMLNNLQQMHLKIAQKNNSEKKRMKVETTGDLIDNNIANRISRKSQEVHGRIINPFTPTRYPTWLKTIQLVFCNPYGGVKTISKESFP